MYIFTGCFKPEFSEPLLNLSVAVGRDAVFRCLVHHLGGYRVSILIIGLWRSRTLVPCFPFGKL